MVLCYIYQIVVNNNLTPRNTPRKSQIHLHFKINFVERFENMVFRGVCHHYIMNLWIMCVYSIIRCCHHSKYHSKFATGRRITIWVLKQNDRKVCSILSFGILTKICFIYVCRVYLRCWDQVSLNFSKHDLYKWSRFSIGYLMAIYYTLSHTFYDFVLAFTLISGDRSQILRDANNELLNTQNIPIDIKCDDGYLGNCG